MLCSKYFVQGAGVSRGEGSSHPDCQRQRRCPSASKTWGLWLSGYGFSEVLRGWPPYSLHFAHWRAWHPLAAAAACCRRGCQRTLLTLTLTPMGLCSGLELALGAVWMWMESNLRMCPVAGLLALRILRAFMQYRRHICDYCYLHCHCRRNGTEPRLQPQQEEEEAVA